MSLDPPTVLLEQSFLKALTDPAAEHHPAAAALYLSLVDQYEREEVLLMAVSDHLLPWKQDRRLGVLAPIDPLHVGFQHRRAAARMPAVSDTDVALTLVMCERHKVRRVATFDPRFEHFDLTLLPGAPTAE